MLTAEPPTFLTTPAAVTKVAKKQTAIIKCRVFGAPKPIISWLFNGEPIDDPRFEIAEDGDLNIHVSNITINFTW